VDDPNQALNHANSLQQPEERAAMQDQVLSSWASSAPDQLADWIKSHPNLQSSDTARQHLTTAWAESRPETAITVANGIRQPELRLQMMQTVLADWQEKNPAATAAYLKKFPQLAPLLSP
jgi:hypothetical protein